MMTQHWPRYGYYKTADYYHRDVYGRLESMRKALSELQLRTGQEDLERTPSMSTLKDTRNDKENDQESKKRLAELTLQVEQQQLELEKLRYENNQMKSRPEEEKQITNGISEDHCDSPLPSDNSSNIVTPRCAVKRDNNALWKRLREAEDRAYEAEARADNLNILLNHKLIEINKLQLTLSNQTKDLIQLEKAYYQLRCHLHKNRKLSSSSVRRMSSKLNNTV